MLCVGFFVVFGQSDGSKRPEGFRRKGVASDDQSVVFNVHTQVYRVGLGRGAIVKSRLKQRLNRSAHIQSICKAFCIAELRFFALPDLIESCEIGQSCTGHIMG